ncbi:hypothetical protein GH714_022390 [Hevea brasiliensis]|uniref:Uncharacterized protein n=1 Tax=Hevea brasiliensis TaxID=3981 RepID=A0A6A6M0T0_HEVBR|nr:hypothetical protein GH714_022390 [Hevea brasiliensis]
MLVATLVIVYKEWIGKAIAAFLLWIVSKMLQARLGRLHDKYNEIVVYTGSDENTTVESIVAAHFGLRTAHEMMQATNLAILKIWSIMLKGKHGNGSNDSIGGHLCSDTLKAHRHGNHTILFHYDIETGAALPKRPGKQKEDLQFKFHRVKHANEVRRDINRA